MVGQERKTLTDWFYGSIPFKVVASSLLGEDCMLILASVLVEAVFGTSSFLGEDLLDPASVLVDAASCVAPR